MTLTITRFDLDETPREANTHRPTPVWSPLPIGFPFLVDKDTGLVNEPALAFLASKCARPDSFSKGRWTKQRTADNYAADLKDWWAKVEASDRAWHEADDELVDDYLLDMKLVLSEHTGDFLSDATIARRRSTLNEFHRFARRRYGHRHLPIASTSNLRNARRAGEDEDETFDAFTLARYDANPRPFDPDDLRRIFDALGPLPEDAKEWAKTAPTTRSGRRRKPTSRTRLALLLAVIVGLRIDEIVHLRADLFDFPIDDRDEDDHFTCELKVAKGLVRRTVYFPMWVVAHLQAYIAGERTEAVAIARRGWLGPKGKPPANLLLNTPSSGRNAGKRTTSKQLDADLLKVLKQLGMTLPRTRAEGTDKENKVDVAKHTFHDGRHTFAYLLYVEDMEGDDGSDNPILARRFEDVVQKIRLRLGHQHVETTINIYLRVFNREGEKALARQARWVRAILSKERKN
jgi:integrase